MKMRGWRMLAAGAAVLAGISCGAAAYAGLQHEAFWQAGQSAAAVQDGGVAVTVNGTPIAQETLDRAMQTEQLMFEESVRLVEEADFLTAEEKQEAIAGMDPPEPEDVERRLIREAALLSAARERGVTVSDAEVDARVEAVNAAVRGMAAAGEQTAQYVQDSLTAYAAGLGMTYAEYTESRIVPAVRDQLMREKLREQVLSEAAQNPSRQSAESAEDAWEAFVEETLARAEIAYPE